MMFLSNPCFLQCWKKKHFTVLQWYLFISQMRRFGGDVGLLPGDRWRAIYPKTWGPTEGWAELRTLRGQGGGVVRHLAVDGRQAAVVGAVGHAEALGRRFGAVH